MTSNKQINPLKISEIFCSPESHYIVPIYQREYAWNERNISQLIIDIADYLKKSGFLEKKPNITPYYIGSLVTFTRKDGTQELIDGQQRLTTLTLLLDYIKNNTKCSVSFENILEFECREDSSKALDEYYDKVPTIIEGFAPEIVNGYNQIDANLNQILKDKKIDLKDFVEYLFNHVIIFRIQVPQDTDLNHYFEIMNSRGEQLEKHEILKSYLIERLDKSDQYAFGQIWDNCSDIDKYIQMTFDTHQKTDSDIRGRIFGRQPAETQWNNLQPQDTVYSVIAQSVTQNTDDPIENTIDEIIKTNYSEISGSDKKKKRFNSLITFPNFLLIVLRIYTNNSSVPLDDKQLMDSFEDILHVSAASSETVKGFGYALLKCKYLFDKYIIKRDLNSNKWSLFKLYNDEGPKYKDVFSKNDEDDDSDADTLRIAQLLCAFHVSQPAQSYKYWIYAALKFLYNQDEKDIAASSYLKYLENLAKAYFFDRYIANDEHQCDFEKIIDINNATSKIMDSDLDWNKLNKGTAVENFVFNYLDYLLWVDCCNAKKYLSNYEKDLDKNAVKAYRFGYHTSVEHYYPRHPINNPNVTVKNVNDFGNLCLIDGAQNARLSNHLPSGKKDFYTKHGIDSIKQRIMLNDPDWTEESINKHGELMKKILADRTLIGT